MSKPELFQGEKYLSRSKNYFEGWYFKNTNGIDSISFIPGISINSIEKRAFIQVITNEKSYFIDYNINDFRFCYDPFYIEIGNNFFSLDKIYLDIDCDDLVLKGDILYSDSINIKKNIFNPNIMGPFSYIPFMECNHAILSMDSSINGRIVINGNEIDFINGNGYIEKDYGVSFPKSYVWLQGNSFKDSRISFMFSMADIPFMKFSFTGLICVLLVNGKEYKFTTYNNSKIVNYSISDELLDITLKRGKYTLNIKGDYGNSLKLIAPIKGRMEKDIFESISSIITVTLYRKSEKIFSDISVNCGLEIVK